MSGWLAIIGSTLTGVILLLRWFLSAEQKRKRRNRYVWKLEKKLRKAMADGNTSAMRRIMRELRLYADQGQPAVEPDDTDNKEG